MLDVQELQQTSWPRERAQVGVVHVGFGAFHRSHQAVYFDDYMEATGDLNWGVAAVNLRSAESHSFSAAPKAKVGYLLRTKGSNGSQQDRLVRSHLEFFDWSIEPTASEGVVARDSVNIITITVTESGYYLKDDWSLNDEDPIISAEISGKPGKTIYSFLASALERRRVANGAPITILCCDNIRSNGRMLESNLKKFLELTNQNDLANWIAENATFPNAMVDRITPVASPELVKDVARRWPDVPLSPVHSEDFIQWVIEDNFAGNFPKLAMVGVQIVDDVDPFEEAKIRILNGGHTGLCYLGALAGYQTFDQVMRDPDLRQHFDRWENENVLPGLNIDLPFDKAEYLSKIAERFTNREIADQLERICMDGWSKMPIYVRPTLASCLAQGISPNVGYKCVASWYVFARRIAAGKMKVPYADPYWTNLAPLLPEGQENAFASSKALWADLPTTYEEFIPSLVLAVKEVDATWPM